MVRKGRYRSVKFMTNLHIEVADFIFADLFLAPQLEHLLQLFRGIQELANGGGNVAALRERCRPNRRKESKTYH